MFNYKRLAFIFFVLALILVLTDSQAEKQSRKSLLSLVDIAVVETGVVSETAPSSILDSFENVRLGINTFLVKQGSTLEQKIASGTGPIYFALSIASYIVLSFKFLSNYVITFYPFVLFLIYLILTSSIFKKNEFDNY